MLDEFLKILLCFLLALSLLISYLHGGMLVENTVLFFTNSFIICLFF